ncbi:unnamed protein product [Ilex paraguariensis]|uniref:Pre-mRNA-splicing factor 38 n=1 Tax=Ilex paraguariensis TaxID=185542 RepID=A0ABC8T7N8_9AQUA
MGLDHLGGTFGGNRKPTPFMCQVMKMLQIQPEKDIVVEFIKNEDYKSVCVNCRFFQEIFVFSSIYRYVRMLGAFYLHLTGIDSDVYRYLESVYNDYRKLSVVSYAYILHTSRWTLEAIGSLEPRLSALEDDFEEEKGEDDQIDGLEDGGHEKGEV